MYRETFENAEPVAAAMPSKGGIARLFGKMTTRRNRRKANELSTMTDRALQDIGVSRHELGFSGHRPMEFDAIRFLSNMHIPDGR